MTELLADIIDSLAKLVDQMCRSSLPRDEPHAITELGSSEQPLVQILALLNERVLRPGPLELDLIDRTAKRGDGHIDLRPREFRLQRSDQVPTRSALLKKVWHFKFVPQTNVVDVQMGLLRRKVDGANEAPTIRNVRGVGFVPSVIPPSQRLPERLVARSTTSRTIIAPRKDRISTVSQGRSLSATAGGADTFDDARAT